MTLASETLYILVNQCNYTSTLFQGKPRQHIKKQSHYFADKSPSSQSYGFPVVMYGCESWTIKKAECQKWMLLNCGDGEDS